MNNREFRQRIADLVASQRRAAYEGPGEDPAPPVKKPPANEAATPEKAQDALEALVKL
jgi:hypothetical protein